MKKNLLLIFLLISLPFSVFSRGGCGGGSHSSCSSSHSSFSSSSHSSFSSSSRPSSFHSSSYSYKSSSTSSHPSTGLKTVSSSSHISPTKSFTHVSEPIHSMTPTRLSYYRNNPSYRSVCGYYRPVYHCSPNYLFWYFVLTNHNSHRNDTIRAKTKEELDRKVKSLPPTK